MNEFIISAMESMPPRQKGQGKRILNCPLIGMVSRKRRQNLPRRHGDAEKNPKDRPQRHRGPREEEKRLEYLISYRNPFIIRPDLDASAQAKRSVIKSASQSFRRARVNPFAIGEQYLSG